MPGLAPAVSNGDQLVSAVAELPFDDQDVAAWPVSGIVMFAGIGFMESMKAFLIPTGKAVEFRRG